jgi:hypothetical protein
MWGNVSPLILLFSFNIVLAILSLLPLHINIRIGLSISIEWIVAILIALVYRSSWQEVDNIEPSYPWRWNVLSFTWSFFIAFIYISICCIFIPTYCILGSANVNRSSSSTYSSLVYSKKNWLLYIKQGLETLLLLHII